MTCHLDDAIKEAENHINKLTPQASQFDMHFSAFLLRQAWKEILEKLSIANKDIDLKNLSALFDRHERINRPKEIDHVKGLEFHAN